MSSTPSPWRLVPVRFVDTDAEFFFVTVGFFAPDDETDFVRISVGIRPNGLAYDAQNDLLLVANVGAPDIPNSLTLSHVKVKDHRLIASLPVPDRTRWTVFDEAAGVLRTG